MGGSLCGTEAQSSSTMTTAGSVKQFPVDEPKSKRPNCEEVEDRISSLPDELRTNIISLLPMKHALKTCILSRSWKLIFSTRRNLSFLEYQFPDVANRVHRFAGLIDWTLANYEGSRIRTLAIHFNILERSYVQLKNAWVNFAVKHNVQHLILTAKINVRQGLPSSLFTCRSLVVFVLTAKVQLLKLPSAICLPNLRRMSLEAVDFPDDTLTEKLFAGCPLLMDLCIRSCGMSRLARLTISCPNLKLLCISYCTGIDKCIVDLHGSCIENFYYDGSLARNFEFGNTNLLSVVVLNNTRNPGDVRNDSELAPVALNLLRASCHARELTISTVFNKVLMEVRVELWLLSCFENLLNVCLFLWATVENKEIVMTLLSKFHCVQKLRLIIYRAHRSADMFRAEMQRDKNRLKGILRHLEHLQIDNFEGFALEMELLEFFLQNATSLTRVTISIPRVALTQHVEDHHNCWLNDERKLEITDNLKRLSNAYPTVSITVLDASEYLLIADESPVDFFKMLL